MGLSFNKIVAAIQSRLPGAAATSATAMGMTPTVQYHPNTSALTMRSNGTMTGYITGGILTVAAGGWANGTSQTVREGVVVSGPGVTTFKVTKAKTGVGNAGDYYTDTVQTVGSAGSPITLTTVATEVATMADLMGNANLAMADPAGTVPGMGPTLCTDGYGRKFLRFQGGPAVAGAWLRNLTLANLDSANMSWFLVGMVRAVNYAGQSISGGGALATTILQTGAQEGTGVGAGSANAGSNLMIYSGMPTIQGYNMPLNYSSDANISKMLLGEQLQVFGTVCATTDGVNGGTTLTATAANRCIQTWVNDKSITLTTSPTNTNRVMSSSAAGSTGFTLGRNSTAASGVSSFDLYELVGFLTGQLGTVMANVPAKAAQVTSAMMANYGLVTLTKNLLCMGDSRSVAGEASGVNITSDGSGYSAVSVLAEQGQPYSLPSNVRILNYGQFGQGIAKARAILDMNPNATANGVTAALGASPNMLFGGGNDYVAFFMGCNEAGGADWPTTANGGGANAINTTALGDDLYSGGYTCVANITNSANGTTGTFTAGTGTLVSGFRVTDAGYSGGQFVSVSGSNVTFTRTESTAHSATATNFAVDGYKTFVSTLISRGFKVLAYAEPRATVTSPNAAQIALANHLVNDLPTDVGVPNPGKLVTGDATTISVGGIAPFGANYQGAATNAGANFIDLLHMTRVGKVNLVSGGDTPNNGYSKRIQALLAL